MGEEMCGFLRTMMVWIVVLAFAKAHEEGGDGGEAIQEHVLTPEQMHGMHAKMDGNSDGKILLKEVMQYSESMRKVIASKDVVNVLEEMDLNKDGKLSLAELMKDMEQWGEGDEEEQKGMERRKELEAEKFTMADENKDGLLDIKELPALFYPETHSGSLELTAKASMMEKDKDGDGLLTPKEFWESHSTSDGEEVTISDEEHADFKKLDKNGDGKLDIEEVKVWESGNFHTEGAMQKLFELADKDNDMHVTKQELEDAREQIAASDAHYHLMEWVE